MALPAPYSPIGGQGYRPIYMETQPKDARGRVIRGSTRQAVPGTGPAPLPTRAVPLTAPASAGRFDTTGIGYQHYHQQMVDNGWFNDKSHLNAQQRATYGTGPWTDQQARQFSTENWAQHVANGTDGIMRQRLAEKFGRSLPASATGTPAPAAQATTAAATPTTSPGNGALKRIAALAQTPGAQTMQKMGIAPAPDGVYALGGGRAVMSNPYGTGSIAPAPAVAPVAANPPPLVPRPDVGSALATMKAGLAAMPGLQKTVAAQRASAAPAVPPTPLVKSADAVPAAAKLQDLNADQTPQDIAAGKAKEVANAARTASQVGGWEASLKRQKAEAAPTTPAPDDITQKQKALRAQIADARTPGYQKAARAVVGAGQAVADTVDNAANGLGAMGGDAIKAIKPVVTKTATNFFAGNQDLAAQKQKELDALSTSSSPKPATTGSPAPGPDASPTDQSLTSQPKQPEPKPGPVPADDPDATAS